MTTELKDLLSLTGGISLANSSSAIGNTTYGSPWTFSVTNLGVGKYDISGTESTAANIALCLASLVNDLKAKKIIN